MSTDTFTETRKQDLAFLVLMHLKIKMKHFGKISYQADENGTFPELLEYVYKHFTKDHSAIPIELMEACEKLPNKEEGLNFLCYVSVCIANRNEENKKTEAA